MNNEKKVIKVGTVELYEDEALKLYNEKKYIVSYGGVYQLHYSDAQKRVYGQKVIDQKGIARRGRFYALPAEQINKILGEKVLNEDTETIKPIKNQSDNMVFEINYSLEGTDIVHEIDAEGYLIVKSQGMEIRSAEKVTEGTNLNALALAMVSLAKETLKKQGVLVDKVDFREDVIKNGEKILERKLTSEEIDELTKAMKSKYISYCKNYDERADINFKEDFCDNLQDEIEVLFAPKSKSR